MKSKSQQGVALVITLILLSVITFMAVTFLVVSRHERERVTTQSSQSDAVNAANAATEQAIARILSSMLARTNGLDFDLLVSTNFVSPAGFTTTQPDRTSITNVNYNYNSGAFITGDDFLQNLNNQELLPRPPVFIVKNKSQLVPDFRYYLDLNRNGIYDTNGFGYWYDDKGNLTTNINYFVGDPEWVGILDKVGIFDTLEFRHSSSNKYVARYAFLAQPVGNTLDINYIHNQAKQLNPKADGYLRDQGFGSWEINLAGFLYYLNTNQWGGQYLYNTNANQLSSGFAFDDALGILRYRYNGSYVPTANSGLRSVFTLFGTPGSSAFQTDFIDGYLRGVAPWSTATAPTSDSDLTPVNQTTRGWSGDDNPRHFFSSQDLFSADPNIITFSNRLYSAGLQTNSSYDRYTFYSLLRQMGVESAPVSPDALNLNYVNVGGLVATNFVAWNNALQFFTNAADRLIKDMVSAYPSNYPANLNLSVTNIPIYPTNYYSSSINRMLQLAANIYDASTNRAFLVGPNPNAAPYYPSVFRPTFGVSGNNIYINGFVEVGANTTDYQTIPFSLPEDAQAVITKLNNTPLAVMNIYNIPWVIGAKKGFPNFNELSMESITQITRRLQIDKHTLDTPRSGWTTNQLYVIGISNVVGAEAWNSYVAAYPRNVEIFVTNNLTMVLTNEYGAILSNNVILTPILPFTSPVAAGTWAGYQGSGNMNADVISFRIPLNTNVLFLPDEVYSLNTHKLTLSTGVNDPFDSANVIGFPVPQFGLNITNRLQFTMRDPNTGRIIDYVQFSMGTNRDMNAEMIGDDKLQVWQTNRISGGTTVATPTKGIVNQLEISAANIQVANNDWKNQTLQGISSSVQLQETTGFRNFYLNQTNLNPALKAMAPFTPTAKFSLYYTWQANDPLVHYTLGDLGALTNKAASINPPNRALATATNGVLDNLGRVNTRYLPWPVLGASGRSDSNSFAINLKDPLITRSDDWDFPTNKFPNIGWLGRVHRGTPWQTVYLKSGSVGSNAWQNWSGNPNYIDAVATQPTNDWRILDLFTVGQNDNATRGRLSVNQTNLAAWAAILQGVVVLTNTTIDDDLFDKPPQYTATNIDPIIHNDAFLKIVRAINNERTAANTNGVPIHMGGVFQHVGDILAVPELTTNSPFLNLTTAQQLKRGISDAAYERIPEQILSLLKVGEARYVIYAYGQALKPAEHSIMQSGQFFGMCTNYQITAEVATRTVVRIENAPVPGKPQTQPRVVVESFNVLPPE
ncbi:MAG: hypothetical protein JWR19_3311 [Pedosphaera sp.]|nr:hypothetical protein [Pedosphaera sp.]